MNKNREEIEMAEKYFAQILEDYHEAVIERAHEPPDYEELFCLTPSQVSVFA